jgi:hypothetical protein
MSRNLQSKLQLKEEIQNFFAECVEIKQIKESQVQFISKRHLVTILQGFMIDQTEGKTFSKNELARISYRHFFRTYKKLPLMHESLGSGVEDIVKELLLEEEEYKKIFQLKGTLPM